MCRGRPNSGHFNEKWNKKNIGQTLQVHPTVKITALFDEEVNSNKNDIAVHQIKEFSPKISMGCSISTLPYLELALSNFDGYKDFSRKNYKQMSTYYSMITPSSYGKIKIVPFSKDPLILYQLNKSDLTTIKEALIKLAKVLFAAGAVKLFPHTLRGNLILKREDDLENKINQLKPEQLYLMTIHLFSSCPMGKNRKICATDPYGKVYGQENLYINDASLLCSAASVNPQGTIMAVARRNMLNFIESSTNR